MGWEDRPYYRDRGPSYGNPLMWILTGSVPLFTAFGIRVRAHAILVISIVLMLLFGFGYPGFTLQDRVTAASILFLIVLLHEFGHCFTARWVGGEADEILMHPLGGLALTQPPRRPWPTFLTVAGGPAVNVVICAVCGALLWWKLNWLPWNPFRFYPPEGRGVSADWFNVLWYAFWIYQVSWQLFMFNLMPIYPLDGGQMVQALLWPRLGYYRSTVVSCNVGMVGSVVGGMIALAFRNVGLGILAAMGFMYCLNMRRQVQAAGPYAFSEEDSPIDYAASLRTSVRAAKRQSRFSKWQAARAKRRAAAEQAEAASEQAQIDAILAKVSAHGMHSLTSAEKRALQKATERQRQRDLETGRARHH
jgi:stage IV sporulation protein FB